MKKRLIVITIFCVLIALISCDSQIITPEPSQSETTLTPEDNTVSPPEEGPIVTPEPTTPPTGELKVHFIDVGQGDSILIDNGNIEVLIDGGRRSSGVVDYLTDYVDGALEVMVATHPHADHIGGLTEVLNTFEVNDIWHNGDDSDSQTYREFKAAYELEDAEVHIARLHDIIQVGDLSFYVHHPTNLERSTNNNSIILYLAYGDIDFLFTGDAETEAEGAMMTLSSIRLPEVEILKVGHHGSRTASSEGFLAVTSPEVVIYMAKEDKSYGHPHKETIQALEEIGAEIYGTDIYGTIIVTTDGEFYTLVLEISNLDGSGIVN